MLQIADILTRADIPALETLIGHSAVRLLKRLDPDLVRPAELRKILFDLRPPDTLLQDPQAWQEFVDLLKLDEANALATEIGLESSPDPWTVLGRTRLSRSRRKRLAAFALLGVSEPDLDESDTPPDAGTVVPTYSLFEHQRRVCEQVLARTRTGSRRVVLHMPTGSGKTRTAMHLIARHLADREPAVTIWLAYSEELCEQAASEFQRAWANLGNREVSIVRFWGKHNGHPGLCQDGLIVAGLGKIYSRALDDLQFIATLADSVSLIIIDEAHQSVAPSYSLILDVLHSKHPETALVGLTATPGRSWDDLDEDRALAEFYSKQKVTLQIAEYSNPIEYLIEHDYLAKPETRTLLCQSGFELSDSDLEEIESALDIPEHILRRLGEDEQRNLRIISEIESLADRHDRILVFAASVENAILLAVALQAHKRVEARVITADTPKPDRYRTVAWFKSATTGPRVLTNYGVLTTGFDAPKTSAAVICRPTNSLVLYSQMIGRATRGVRAGGNRTAEIVTVTDTALPGFRDMGEAFYNWEDSGWQPTT